MGKIKDFASVTLLSFNEEVNMRDFVADLLEMKDTLTNLAINCD